MENVPKRQADGIASLANDKFYEAWQEDANALKAKQAERLKAESNLGKRFQSRTFETFEQEKNPVAFHKCVEYVEQYEDSERNCLIIIGDYGTGKTHLASSIANALMGNGIPVLFDTFDGHLSKLKAEFNGNGNAYLGKMQNVDMLILDDVGKEKQTEWSRSIMFSVINYRYEHMLPYVMTTNLNSKDLEEYLGGAVWSRLCETCRGVKTIGGDYRKGEG